MWKIWKKNIFLFITTDVLRKISDEKGDIYWIFISILSENHFLWKVWKINTIIFKTTKKKFIPIYDKYWFKINS